MHWRVDDKLYQKSVRQRTPLLMLSVRPVYHLFFTWTNGLRARKKKENNPQGLILAKPRVVKGEEHTQI